MSENVVSLRGSGAVSAAGEPEPDVVQYCEDLLGRAQRGEVLAVAAVEVLPNRAVVYGFSNPQGDGKGHILLSGLYTLMRRLDEEMR